LEYGSSYTAQKKPGLEVKDIQIAGEPPIVALPGLWAAIRESEPVALLRQL